MTEVKEKTEKIQIFDPDEMMQAGLHFGHRSSKTHPKMKPYIQGVKNNIHIINVEKTGEKLVEALKFIKDIASEGKILLLVGTKIQAKDLVKETAKACGLPYVSERWLGGTFTNFGIIRKRIEYYKDLERKRDSGELEKYTKKERANFDHKIRAMETKFGGIKNMERLPDAILALDMIKDELAIKEAKQLGIKIIGISDTNTNPDLADYMIPANDDAITSLKYILEKVKETILRSKK